MSPTSSTEPAATELIGLDFDRFFAPPAVDGVGTPVLIDKDQDAQITLADGASIKELSLFTEANAVLGIKLTAGEVEISTEELEEGRVIEIDNVPIGTVTYYDGQFLEIDFVAATTPAEIEALRSAVEKLIRALTFTNLDEVSPSPERMVSIFITDSMDNNDDAQVLVADQIHGDGESNVIEIANANISWGDEIDGGAGADTLKLTTGGIASFTGLSRFEGIETILGSSANDTIYMLNSQIETIDSINGGGQAEDRLHISGDAIDLRGIGVSGFAWITYEGVGTMIAVDSLSVAKMLDGTRADDETLTIAGGALTDYERLQLHKKGIDFIVHNGRKTTLADVKDAVSPTPPTPTTPTAPAADKPLLLTGMRGKDVLTGASASDTLNGGYGNDVLTGGTGADHFVFNAKLGTWKTDRKVNFDTITDFTRGEDKILLDNKIFKKLGKGTMEAPGTLNKKFFKKTKATDKNDYLIYKSGVVSYDADGNGAKYKPVEIMKIANKAALSAADFLIV